MRFYPSTKRDAWLFPELGLKDVLKDGVCCYWCSSPFRFRPVKGSIPSQSTPESYFTPSIPGFSTNAHVSRIRKKREIGVKVGARLWLVCISGVCVSRSARVNVNNSPKTSDITFQPQLRTPWTKIQLDSSFDLSALLSLLLYWAFFSLST